MKFYDAAFHFLLLVCFLLTDFITLFQLEPDLEGGADKAAAAEAKSEPHGMTETLINTHQI